MKEFFKKYKKEAALVTGLLLCLFFFFVNPLELGDKAKLVLSIAALMISWWVLDAMPLAVVALVPIVLFPLLNISTLKEVTKSYSDSIIFLFMGGFFIGIAIEKWNLHKRIALGIINITGTNGNRIILGFIIATGFLSMWLSNTATTMMMFPIAMSVIHVINTHNKESTAGADAVHCLCIKLCTGHHHWHATQCGLCKLYTGEIQLYHWLYRLDDCVYSALCCTAVYVVLGDGKISLPKQNKTQCGRKKFY
jgi:di/tricarboxylate transporter